MMCGFTPDSASGFFSATADLFFPPRCICCGAVLARGEQLCGDCEREMLHCRIPENDGNGFLRIFSSSFRSCEFDGFTAPFYYTSPVKTALLKMKFGQSPGIARYFAYKTAERIQNVFGAKAADIVCFVPLSKARKNERGYDQSGVFAKYVSRYTGLEFSSNALMKLYDVPAQHSCPYFLRFGNVFGVYEANPVICRNKTVLLCDDICTSGSTLNECAKMLKIAGANRVLCAAAAKAGHDRGIPSVKNKSGFDSP